jgi:hypothetical protein
MLTIRYNPAGRMRRSLARPHLRPTRTCAISNGTLQISNDPRRGMRAVALNAALIEEASGKKRPEKGQTNPLGGA